MIVTELRSEVTNFVQKVANDQKIIKYEIINVQTNQKGEGFLGEIYMITLRDAATGKEHHVIIKAAFQSEKVRTTAPIRRSFENEIYFYSSILPAYKKFEAERGVSDPRIFAPLCYRTTLESEQEMIALENLKELGFETVPKKAILDDAHVKMIFGLYGRLHAYSMALRDQQRELFDELTKDKLHSLFDFFADTNFIRNSFNELFAKMGGYLVPGEDDNTIKCYKKYLNNQVMDRFKEALTANVDYPAVLHGDCWSNNMLFKYKNEEDKRIPVDMRLIDFQLIKLGSPVCDLSYCFYSGVSPTELNNFDEYLRIYHDSFSQCARELGSDPEKLYPFDGLVSDWKKYSKFGMIMGLTILKMKLAVSGEIKDFTDLDLNDPEAIKKNDDIKYDEEAHGLRSRAIFNQMAAFGAL